MTRKLAVAALVCSSALLVLAQSVRAERSDRASARPQHIEIGGSGPVGQPPADEQAPVASRPSNLTEFLITRASKRHDFRMIMHQGCTSLFAGSEICEGPATLCVLEKGSATEVQRLTFPNLSVVRVEKDEVLVNNVAPYGYQGSLVVEDFNFDGHPDLAVQVGQDGPYGGPTFQVFLYRARLGRFEPSKKLSALTEQNLGMFEVIPASKRIATFAKSGCCYHVTQEYVFVGNDPVVVFRYIEDATGIDGFLTATTERVVNGRWVRRVHRERLPDWGQDW